MNKKYIFEEKNKNKYFIKFPYPYMKNLLNLDIYFHFQIIR